MTLYIYRGIDAKGQVCQGWLLAKSVDLARVRLEKRNILVRELAKRCALWGERPQFSREALLLFTQSLAELLHSGMPLLDSLTLLRKQSKATQEQALIQALEIFISQGGMFSDALEQFPRVFDACYIQCVRAGEVAGSLTSVLRELVAYLERQEGLRRNVKRACVYPAAVLCVAFVVVLLLLVGVVPRFERLFEDLFQGAALPWMTRCVLSISRFLTMYGGAYLVLGIIVFMAALWLIRRRKQRGRLVTYLQRVPWLRRIQSSADLARWTRIQGVLMQAGVPLLRSLETSCEVVTSTRLKKQLEGVYVRVRDGERFATSLAREGILPPLLLSLLETGEQTGVLTSELLTAADRLEEDLRGKLSTLTTLLEPCLIVILSLVVGSLVVSLFLPMVGVLEQLATY